LRNSEKQKGQGAVEREPKVTKKRQKKVANPIKKSAKSVVSGSCSDEEIMTKNRHKLPKEGRRLNDQDCRSSQSDLYLIYLSY
jgi:hypothetical protein